MYALMWLTSECGWLSVSEKVHVCTDVVDI